MFFFFLTQLVATWLRKVPTGYNVVATPHPTNRHDTQFPATKTPTLRFMYSPTLCEARAGLKLHETHARGAPNILECEPKARHSSKMKKTFQNGISEGNWVRINARHFVDRNFGWDFN